MPNSEKSTFSQRFPEAGEVSLGSHLTGEQAKQFARIIGNKVFSLSRKAELSEVEKTFVDRTMDITARTIIYAINQRGMHLVQTREAHATRNAVAKLRGITELPLSRLVDEMDGITGGSVSIRSTAAPQHLVEDAAGYGIQLFGQMVEDVDGVTLDTYLEGNLREIMNHFETVSTKS
jgi:hypothetical protein